MVFNDLFSFTAATLLTVASIQAWVPQIGDRDSTDRMERQLSHMAQQIEQIKNTRKVGTQGMLDVSVSIRTVSHVRVDKVGDSVWDVGGGSGFLVSITDCIVWTNHHVVKDAALIEVYPQGWHQRRGISATVVNSSPRVDLAILRMESCEKIPAAQLGDSDLVEPGDDTYAVGNPLGRNPDSISGGIISHTARDFSGVTPYLQTDAAINPGNSGGALFNRNGDVIGINTAIASIPGTGNTGIGYAIPINAAKASAARLMSAAPSWPKISIEDHVTSLTPEEAEVFHVPDGLGAIIITENPSDEPAVGKLFTHDVIFKIDDTGIIDVDHAKRTISRYAVGETLTLHLVRAGRNISVDIILAEGWTPGEIKPPDYYEGYLGMTLETWQGMDGEKGQFQTPVITKIQSLGPAHAAEISSSQSGIAMRGPFVVPYLIDVKTVTGVVYDGLYRPVVTISEVSHFAAEAFRTNAPLLLEIEFWARPNPTSHAAGLQLKGTKFFKVVPTAAHASTRGVGDGREGQPVAEAARSASPDQFAHARSD